MDLNAIETTIQQARQAAQERPGRYGGRYVGRRYDRTANADRYGVLDDDDPDEYRDDESLDILCHVTPTAVYGIGHARHWINEDGTINREFFDGRTGETV